MKNIIKSVLIAASAVIVSACDLSEFSHTDYSPSVVFSTESSVQQALYGLYGELPKVTSTYTSDFGSVPYLQVGSLNDRFVAGYGADNVDKWSDWDDLRSINYFISMVNSSICTINSNLKPNFVGIAKFLRAKKYFSWLVEYGDMPWYDHPLGAAETEEMYKDRESRDLIVKNIIDDLDYAIDNITDESIDRTTPDKYCALLLKSRVCLFEASYRKYHNLSKSTTTGEAFSNYTVEKLYTLAAEAAGAIMDSGKYSLNTASGTNGAYRDLFTSTALLKNEVLLGAATAPGTIEGSQNNAYNQASANHSLTRAFVNIYLMKDGTPFTDKAGYETMSFVDEFKNRDERLAQTVRGPEYKMIAEVGGKSSVRTAPDIKSMAAPLGYHVIKFSLDKTLVAGEIEGKHNTNSTPLYRYAEALLNYAEAKAELGNLSDADWNKTVGALRSRAGVSPTKPSKADNYFKANFYPAVSDPTILEILRERLCELCIEGPAGNDWKRFASGESFATFPWKGIHFEALNTAVDINGDGTADYYFSDKEPSATAEKSIWVAVKLSGSEEGLYAVANSKGGYDLEYRLGSNKRNWEKDGRLYLGAISQEEISKYKQNGFTLTQNPGY